MSARMILKIAANVFFVAATFGLHPQGWAISPILTAPGTITGTFQGDAYASTTSPGAAVFTPAAGRNARVTDVFLWNEHTSACAVTVELGGTSTFFIVPAMSSREVTPASGWGVNSGSNVTANTFAAGAAANCPATSVFVTVRGFYYTIP